MQSIAGHKFGYLRVITFSHHGRNGVAFWHTVCECGSEQVKRRWSLTHTSSCGCMTHKVLSQAHRRHGMSNTPTWNSWKGMRVRCSNPKHHAYYRYGGRGISVTPRWESFENFLTDMGPRPAGTTLDRRELNGNYCKSNCRWATVVEQNRNHSRVKLTPNKAEMIRKALVQGVPPQALAVKYGVSTSTISLVKLGKLWK
jgi:hypothetical protein